MINFSFSQIDSSIGLFEKYRIELQQLDTRIQKIDQIVYKLYDLSPDEINLVEDTTP